MTRAVLDTNVLVSGLGWGGIPGAVVDAALAGRFEMVTSAELLEELRRVLGYPKLASVLGDVDEIVGLVAMASIVVEPDTRLSVARDPDDNRLIEAAIAGGAEVIVTGDDDLLVLETVEGVRIIRPAKFLDSLQGQ